MDGGEHVTSAAFVGWAGWIAILLSMALAWPVEAGPSPPATTGDETSSPSRSPSGAPGDSGAATIAILNFHVPSARVAHSRIRSITRRVAALAEAAVDGEQCRLLAGAEVRARTGREERSSCLTAECMADIGRKTGATYLVKGIIASVSGGLMVRLDMRDGATGAVLASQSLVVSRKRDLEPVAEWLLLSLLGLTPGTGVVAADVPPPPRRVQAFASLKELRRTHYVPPAYPSRARRRQIEGVVMVEVSCSASGRVKQVRWLSGDRVFRRAVRRAVRAWEFEPRPVDFRFRQPVWFSLDMPDTTEAVTAATVETRPGLP